MNNKRHGIPPGYENQPEILGLFRSSNSRPNTRSVELKSSKEQEARRKSMLHLAEKLSLTNQDGTEANAVPTEETKATFAVPKPAFLEELCKNEQYKFRQASIEALESEKDEE